MNALDSQFQVRSVPASRLIRGKLAALGRRHLHVALLTGFALATAVAVEVMAVAMFLDWWLDLPRLARALLLLLQAGLLAFLLARHVALPLLRRPDEDALALMVERAKPQFHSRLISAVQLTRAGAIPPNAAISLVDALVDETEQISSNQDFSAIVPTDRLKKFGLLALIVLLLAAAGFALGGDLCRDLLKRAFLANIPVPRKTRVVVLDGDKIIGRGDPVRVEARAEGIVPADGRVEVRYRDRRPQAYPLEQNLDDPRHFGRTIDKVTDHFDYVIRLNDGVSAAHHVTVIPRPAVASIECLQVPPAYTGEDTRRRLPGDLTLMAGSVLHLRVEATKEISRAALRLVGPGEELSLAVNPTNRTELTGSFSIPAEGLTGFSVLMVDTQNMATRDPAVYRIEIVADQKPRVRITSPERKEELVTREAVLPVGMRIEDDHAIGRIRLHYKVDTVADGEERRLLLDLEGATPAALQRQYLWHLGSFSPLLSEGSMIEFWLTAEDNNDVTGPGVGESEHHLARVVSVDEKRAELLNRAGDYLGGLDDVADDQEKANQNLGTIIRSAILEQAPPPP